jgi:acetylornithine deacetylase/succinyl-diaminopimelate desuccinylase-like protein
MYSGPLHDAVEMAKLVPTIIMFAMSERGLSHCKEENTSDEALETAIRAFLRLADKAAN